MIVETRLAKWELDLDRKRVRFVAPVETPDTSDPVFKFFNAEMQPHCYAEVQKNDEGWVSCLRVDPPEVGKRLVVVYSSGVEMASSTVQEVTL